MTEKTAKSKHPKFQRANYGVIKIVKVGWRRPRGIDSKQRQKLKWAGGIPNKGYQIPKEERHKMNGLVEIKVHNVQELLKIDVKTQVARVASAVGGKKRDAMKKVAVE